MKNMNIIVSEYVTSDLSNFKRLALSPISKLVWLKIIMI